MYRLTFNKIANRLIKVNVWRLILEAFLESCQTSRIGLFLRKQLNSWQLLTTFAKSFILDVWQCLKNAFVFLFYHIEKYHSHVIFFDFLLWLLVGEVLKERLKFLMFEIFNVSLEIFSNLRIQCFRNIFPAIIIPSFTRTRER